MYSECTCTASTDILNTKLLICLSRFVPFRDGSKFNALDSNCTWLKIILENRCILNKCARFGPCLLYLAYNICGQYAIFVHVRTGPGREGEEQEKGERLKLEMKSGSREAGEREIERKKKIGRGKYPYTYMYITLKRNKNKYFSHCFVVLPLLFSMWPIINKRSVHIFDTNLSMIKIRIRVTFY